MDYEDVPDYLRNDKDVNQRLLKKLIKDPKATKYNIVPMYSDTNHAIKKAKEKQDEKNNEKVRRVMVGLDKIRYLGKKPTPEEIGSLEPIESGIPDDEIEKELLDTVCDLTDVCKISKPMLKKVKNTQNWVDAKKMIRTHIAMDKRVHK